MTEHIIHMLKNWCVRLNRILLIARLLIWPFLYFKQGMFQLTFTPGHPLPIYLWPVILYRIYWNFFWGEVEHLFMSHRNHMCMLDLKTFCLISLSFFEYILRLTGTSVQMVDVNQSRVRRLKNVELRIQRGNQLEFLNAPALIMGLPPFSMWRHGMIQSQVVKMFS